MAGLLNNLAVASTLAASLQPGLAVLRQHQLFKAGDAATSLLLFGVATIRVAVAQVIARRLED